MAEGKLFEFDNREELVHFLIWICSEEIGEELLNAGIMDSTFPLKIEFEQ